MLLISSQPSNAYCQGAFGNPSSKPRLALLTAYSNRYHLDAHVDKHNAGIVVVNLAGPKGGGSLDFTRDIARHATGNDQECVVM